MSIPATFERIIQPSLPRGSVRTIYVRNTGDNDNPGTLASPVGTLRQAISMLSADPSGYARQVVELTGYTEVSNDTLYASLPASSRRFELDFTRAAEASDGSLDYWDVPVEFIAEPTLVQLTTIASIALDAVTNLPTVTVNEVLVPNAHVGQIFWAAWNRRGIIASNTASELVIASWSTAFENGAGVGIYEQSCSLDFGDPTKSFCGTWLTANSFVVFNGIKFGNTQSGNASFGIVPKDYVYFNMCHFAGFDIEPGTLVTSWYCYYHTANIFLEGPFDFQGCVFNGIGTDGHGSGGLGRNAVKYCIFDGCGPIGAGNWESEIDVEVNNSLIINGTSHGILRGSAIAAKVGNCRIDDCAGDAIHVASGGGLVKVDGVVGGGNAGYGLQLTYGGSALDQNGNTVTGDLGDIKLPGLPTATWADTPISDINTSNTGGCKIEGGTSVSTVAPSTHTRYQTQVQSVTYVRNTGNDDNPGTLASPLRTLGAALDQLHTGPQGLHRQVIDMTGFVDTITNTIIETPSGGWGSNDLFRVGGLDNGRVDVFNMPFEIRADPLLVQTITVTNESSDATTGHITLTVSDTLVVDAHKGQWVDGGTGLGGIIIGVIVANTETTLTLAGSSTGYGGTSTIYTQSCVLSGADFALMDIVCNGPTMLQGIKLVNTYGASDRTSLKYRLAGGGKLSLHQCSVEGIASIREEATSGVLDLWYCYVTTRLWCEQSAHIVHDTVLDGCNLNFHGSGGGGLNELADCILDGCTPYGGTNHESNFDVEVNDCYIRNAQTHGIRIGSPVAGVVRNTRIDDSGADAINIPTGGGIKIVDNVVGSGNVGYGCQATNGAQVNDVNTNTVAGALGQVKVGSSAASNWGGVERTDIGEANPQFCRIF